MSTPQSKAGRDPVAPRVSVITIFHNEERYLREAVDSVLAQDFDPFELLLVDDGSTDSSSAIAKGYAAQHAGRVRYLHHSGHENRGMSATRNLGLGEARGEFVAFIDADDRWRPSKLKEQVELLDSLPEVDAVGGSVNYWASHDGGVDRIVPTGHVRNRLVGPGEATLALYPLGNADAPSMSDLLFRRSSILKVGGFEEGFRGAYEDQAFLAKFYLQSTLYVTDAVWSDYRLHDKSCMAQLAHGGGYHGARRQFLEWFDAYLGRTVHRDDAQIQHALNRALRRYRPRRQRLVEAVREIPFAVPLVRTARASLDRLLSALSPGPAILMYHRVANERFDPWGLAVSPDNFAGQLDWLARNRTVLPLAEFAQLHAHGALPKDAVAVTFDDGYACNVDVALPLLERLGIPATIFLPADLIGREQEFWWDELERIVLGHEGETLTLDGQEFALGERQADDFDWPPGRPPRTPRQGAYRQLWSQLYQRKREDLESGMEQLRRQAKVPPSPRKSHRPMAPGEFGNLRSSAVEFGSHTLSHASLPMLSPHEKAREIRDSIDRCAELTGSPPRTFAYPYGDFDAESERLVAEAGYVCACKAEGKFVTRRSKRFALPRIFVGNWDSTRLARQLGGRC